MATRRPFAAWCGRSASAVTRFCFWNAIRRGPEPIAIRLQFPVNPSRLALQFGELRDRWRKRLAEADLVIVGSYVPDGIAVIKLVNSIANGIVAFYDIDTPVTLASSAAAGNCAL